MSLQFVDSSDFLSVSWTQNLILHQHQQSVTLNTDLLAVLSLRDQSHCLTDWTSASLVFLSVFLTFSEVFQLPPHLFKLSNSCLEVMRQICDTVWSCRGLEFGGDIQQPADVVCQSCSVSCFSSHWLSLQILTYLLYLLQLSPQWLNYLQEFLHFSPSSLLCFKLFFSKTDSTGSCSNRKSCSSKCCEAEASCEQSCSCYKSNCCTNQSCGSDPLGFLLHLFDSSRDLLQSTHNLSHPRFLPFIHFDICSWKFRKFFQ